MLGEAGVNGREIELAVLGGDPPTVSVAGEITIEHPDGFYSYDAKYIDEKGVRFDLPARLSAQQLSEAQAMALQTFEVLECEGLARVDLFLTADGRFLVNEINTLPGFTAISMYPKLWALSGIAKGIWYRGSSILRSTGPSGALNCGAPSDLLANQFDERTGGIMSEQEIGRETAFPYATHLNVLIPPLETVDVPALVAAVKDRWYNQTLCQVNGSVVRLGVMQGEYHWHKHDEDDEFFFCLDGEFLIDLEDRTVALSPQQGFVVPKGIVHRTRAPQRCVILMVENAGIVPTGD